MVTLSRIPSLRSSLAHALTAQPFDYRVAESLQRDLSLAVEQERRTLALIEAAKDITDGPYPCSCEDGWVCVEIPVFADGGYSDVDQIYEPCPVCNRPATDEDYELAVSCGLLDFEDYGSQMDWQDIPALWNQDYPGIDYDEAFRDAQYSGI